MKELELKYGCNPNQKPSRIYLAGRKELPIVLSGKPGYINFLDAFNGWQLVRDLKKATGLPAATSFKHVSPAGAAIGLPLTETLARIYWVDDMDWKNFSRLPALTQEQEVRIVCLPLVILFPFPMCVTRILRFSLNVRYLTV